LYRTFVTVAQPIIYIVESHVYRLLTIIAIMRDAQQCVQRMCWTRECWSGMYRHELPVIVHLLNDGINIAMQLLW